MRTHVRVPIRSVNVVLVLYCANTIDSNQTVNFRRVYGLLKLETTTFAETQDKLLLENFTSFGTGTHRPAPLRSYTPGRKHMYDMYDTAILSIYDKYPRQRVP